MYRFPIGAIMESFRLEPREALKKAKELGFDGVQMYAKEHTFGDKTYWTMIRDTVRDLGLTVSAVCGDLGYHFNEKAANNDHFEKMKKIYDIAAFLGVNVVTTHIGVVPQTKDHPRYGLILDGVGKLCEYAAGMNAYLAIETGPEPAPVLKGFLDDIGSKGGAVNLDPANLAMTTGDDAAEAVNTLGHYIVHTHAKDGVLLKSCDPEIMYGIIPCPGFDEADYCREVPLGKGDVKWPAYLEALTEIGYRGFLTIEREVGADPAADIAEGAEFLRSIIK